MWILTAILLAVNCASLYALCVVIEMIVRIEKQLAEIKSKEDEDDLI